jgi:hypothetical protein
MQSAMRKELAEKIIFDLAQGYAYEYLDQVLNRHIFPTENALANLSHFDEDMPSSSISASEVN